MVVEGDQAATDVLSLVLCSVDAMLTCFLSQLLGSFPLPLTF